MKTLLIILGSVTVGVSPAIATVAAQPSYNQDLKLLSEKDIWEAPTSMQALQEGINKHFESVAGPKRWAQSIEWMVQADYNTYFADKTSTLRALKTELTDEIIEETFTDTYVNRTPNKQTFQTHAYSREVSNTTSFTIQLQEEVDVSVSTNFMFGGASINASLSSTQAWTNSQSTTQTVTAPSQEFVVDAHSTGTAVYNVMSNQYDVTAALSVRLPLETAMWTSLAIPDSPGPAYASYTLREIIGFLNEAGYGDMMRTESEEFCVITTDNPDKPSMVSLNLPANYVTEGGKLDVDFFQEPLN